MMSLKIKYGQLALIAGGSEGIGASFANYLASKGVDLILVARQAEKLENKAEEIKNEHAVKVSCISCDLSDPLDLDVIKQKTADKEIDIFVYNAALSYIGHFEKNSAHYHSQIAQVNMLTPMSLIHLFGPMMLKKEKGAIILMSSMAGFQGSGFLSVYAASKAYNRILAESLWYEWKDKGVDVIACCAGATSTPGFLDSNPEKSGLFAPRIQTPDEVVVECFNKLGKTPSIVTGTGNKVASFIMQRVLPRKLAVRIMGDTTRKLYRL